MKDGEIIASITRPVELEENVNIMPHISFEQPGIGECEPIRPWLDNAVFHVKRIVNKLAKTI